LARLLRRELDGVSGRRALDRKQLPILLWCEVLLVVVYEAQSQNLARVIRPNPDHNPRRTVGDNTSDACAVLGEPLRRGCDFGSVQQVASRCHESGIPILSRLRIEKHHAIAIRRFGAGIRRRGRRLHRGVGDGRPRTSGRDHRQHLHTGVGRRPRGRLGRRRGSRRERGETGLEVRVHSSGARLVRGTGCRQIPAARPLLPEGHCLAHRTCGIVRGIRRGYAAVLGPEGKRTGHQQDQAEKEKPEQELFPAGVNEPEMDMDILNIFLFYA